MDGIPDGPVIEVLGAWTGFDFAEEREKVRGTVGGDLESAV